MARSEGKSFAAVVREAVAAYVAGNRVAPGVPSIAGTFASDQAHVSERVDDLLWSDLWPRKRSCRLSRGGELTVEPLEVRSDCERAAALMVTYRDARLGFVDATIVAMAERMGVIELLTTDRRHFSLVRPNHVRAFSLLP